MRRGPKKEKKKQHKDYKNRGKLRKEPDFTSLQKAKDGLTKQHKEMHQQRGVDRYKEIREALTQPEMPVVEQSAAHEAYRTKYFSQFKKVVDSADVLLEVLDARDPLGCRSKKLEDYIMKRGKRLILVMNKADLVPVEICNKWLTFLRREFPTVLFKSSNNPTKANYVPLHDGKWRSSDVFGIDDLLKLLNKFSGGTTITAGVIGPPNAGKSSVINSLSRRAATGVGATPGFTKTMQEVEVTSRIRILDCPGVVPSSGSEITPSMVLRNSIKIELLDDPVQPVAFIIDKVPKEQLVNVYGIETFSDADDFLSQLAIKRGRVLKGNEPDIESIARSVLEDWNKGRIKYFTIPPTSDDLIEASTELITETGEVYQMGKTMNFAEQDFRNFQIQHVFSIVQKNKGDEKKKEDAESDEEGGEEEREAKPITTPLHPEERAELDHVAEELQGISFSGL
ncbi:hypothetical protein TRFO_08903 [Tritrichomonas foetus]|uniref:CP-type G domain-containing protein n=1 Tax=Tritrichomonas foetus TaxID=1144522 RepID=A0A1J4JLA5_9EUKA|nr:hypothetical protein TRFO_08903 [Tritrichomonas foetus]|eukprot:OHS98333.1 hypothetical protein TRFO_08903 [Tritrichomonas foetus]